MYVLILVEYLVRCTKIGHTRYHVFALCIELKSDLQFSPWMLDSCIFLGRQG